jgi:hypothetical protein
VRLRLLLILVAGLLAALLVIIAQNGEGKVGSLSIDQFGSLAYQIVLAVFVGAAVIVMSRSPSSSVILIASSYATCPTG